MSDIHEEYDRALKEKAYEMYNGTCYAVASYYESTQPFLKGWRRSNVSCPEHADRSPSLHIYRDNFKCFTAGCNMHGDAYALIMHIAGCSFIEAQNQFAEILGMPTYNEYIHNTKGTKIRTSGTIKKMPVSDDVLTLLGLGDESTAIVSSQILDWIDTTGKDEAHDISNDRYWYGEMDNKPVYITGQSVKLSIKDLWNQGNYALVHRMIKGKITEKFRVLKETYSDNKWNDPNSVYYKQYILHDVLEKQMDTLIEIGAKYGLDLSYKKIPTYTK